MRFCFSIAFIALLLTAAPVALAETIVGKVVAVADGDTITVLRDETQYKIRFHGVDTPESGQDYGRAAKDYTAEHCFQQEVTVVVLEEDRYGRKVGLVILEDGRVLNHELVAAGMAHWYEYYAKGDEALKRLQEEAKAAKRGLWSRPDVITPYDFRKGERNGNAEPYNPPTADGDDGDRAAGLPAAAAADLVYVTDTGSKYHRANCRTLRESKTAMALEKAKKAYGPCGICTP